MNLAELKERTTELMGENITFSKLDLLLFSAVVLLAGVCLGLLTAPFTHGISFGSFNGCNTGNTYGSSDEDCEE